MKRKKSARQKRNVERNKSAKSKELKPKKTIDL
jgi:hypothetical protein